MLTFDEQEENEVFLTISQACRAYEEKTGVKLSPKYFNLFFSGQVGEYVPTISLKKLGLKYKILGIPDMIQGYLKLKAEDPVSAKKYFDSFILSTVLEILRQIKREEKRKRRPEGRGSPGIRDFHERHQEAVAARHKMLP